MNNSPFRWRTGARLGPVLLAVSCAAATGAASADPPSTSTAGGAGAAPTADQADTFTVREFVIQGDLSTSGRLRSLRFLRRFRSEHATVASLSQAAAALEADWRRHGRLYHVTVPEQDLSEGIARLQLQPIKVHRVESGAPATMGNERLHRLLPTLVEGQSPDLQAVGRNVALVNENPVRHATLTFKSAGTEQDDSRQPAEVDVVVQPEISSPWIASVEVNNQGPSIPSRWRAQMLVANGNLFDLGHVLSLSFTAAPTAFNDVRQYGAFYTIPWYEQGATFSVYGFKSTSRTGAVDGLITVSGVGQFVGFAMKQRILASGPWTPSWTLTVDDKRFDDSSSVQGQTIGSPVRSRPLSVGTALAWDGTALHASVGAQFVDNLPGGSDSGDSSYGAVRPQARHDWQALRLSAEGSQRLPWGDAWVARASAQLTNDALISGEQFGLGGSDSVRALEPRQFNGDRGWSTSIEYWSREWRPGLRTLAFVDAGRVYDTHAAGVACPGALAVGLGARYTINSHVSLSADWGHVVRGFGGADDHAQRLYVAFDLRL
jgi:hemolysin activation/secretion protein